MWLLSTSPRTSTPITCSQPDPVVVCEENEAPVANLPDLELPHDWQQRCVVSGLSHQRRPWPSHRCAGVTSVKHIHISSLLEVISKHSSCSFSRKQANTLVLLPLPRPYMALSAYHYVMAILVLSLMFLKLDWDIVTTCWTQRPPRRDKPPVSATHNGKKIKILKRNGWPAGNSYSAKDRQPSRVTFLGNASGVHPVLGPGQMQQGYLSHWGLSEIMNRKDLSVSTWHLV